jgi:type I restriction enzyme S subunit
MKQGWEIKKLGEVLLKTELVDPTQNPDKEFTYLDVSSVNKETKVIEGATVLLGKNAPSRARKLVKLNDVIFATVRPTHSRVALITEEYDSQICSTGYFVLRPREDINHKYLFYFLLTDHFNQQMEKLQKGASYPAVTDTEVKNIQIKYPKSLPEQQRIVSVLDKCFAAIDKAKANAERNLKNAKELFESYLQGVFENGNWERKTLKELTTKIGSGSTPRGGQENYKTEGVSLVRSMNVHDWEFRERNLAFIDERQAKELDGVTLQEDDVLLNITGASVARSCVFPKKYLPARVNQHVSIIRPKKEILDSKFLNLLLTSRPYKDQLLFTGEQGATRQAITKAQIESFRISIPTLKQQQTIVRQLDALRAETQKLEAVYQKKITDLEELKKSILQKAFSGELETEKEIVI